VGSGSLGPIVSADWAYVVKQFGLDCFSVIYGLFVSVFLKSEYRENYM
jgi:hypothetical protein